MHLWPRHEQWSDRQTPLRLHEVGLPRESPQPDLDISLGALSALASSRGGPRKNTPRLTPPTHSGLAPGLLNCLRSHAVGACPAQWTPGQGERMFGGAALPEVSRGGCD